jgi:hypothetical protein
MRLSVLCLAFLAALTLALSAGAQTFNRDAYLEARVNAIRQFFAMQGEPSRELAIAQRFLSAYDENGRVEADGVWGPATANRFRGVIDTMTTIGIPIDSTDPYIVTETVLNWFYAGLRANIGIGDYPD